VIPRLHDEAGSASARRVGYTNARRAHDKANKEKVVMTNWPNSHPRRRRNSTHLKNL